jgi:hypothetical protein
MIMFTRIVFSSLLGTCAVLGQSEPAAATPSTEQVDHADPRDIVGKAKISLADAIGRALAACPGAAVEADLEGEIVNGAMSPFFEVMVVGKDGMLHEVKLDPASGAIQSNEAASDADEIEELAAFRAVLRHTELGLVGLLGKVGEVVNGYPVKAALEFEDGQPHCEVVVVHGRYLIEAKLEARAGHLLELELLAAGDEQDEEQGEEEEGEQREAKREHGEKHGERKAKKGREEEGKEEAEEGKGEQHKSGKCPAREARPGKLEKPEIHERGDG